jgi:hypothetical protein
MNKIWFSCNRGLILIFVGILLVIGRTATTAKHVGDEFCFGVAVGVVSISVVCGISIMNE